MDTQADSQLNRLMPRQQPDPHQLMMDVRLALQQATNTFVWSRLEHNHWSRFWGQQYDNFNFTKARSLDELPEGLTGLHQVHPFPGAANLRPTKVNEIILQLGDTLTVAADRAHTEIMPELLDGTNNQRMARAEAWGGVLHYEKRRAKSQRRRFLRQMADLALEYGHSVGRISWRGRRKTVGKTISAEKVAEFITAALLEQQGSEPTENGPDDAATEQAEQAAAFMIQDMAADDTLKPALVDLLMQYDPEMTKKEAARAASRLKTGEELTYFVATEAAAGLDYRALTPGLDVFYPVDTTRIAEARLIVVSDWLTQVELEAMIEDDDWNETNVDKLIELGPAATAGAFGGVQPWILSRGIIGMDVDKATHLSGTAQRFQVLWVYYQASAIDGTPCWYRTVLAPRLGDQSMLLRHAVAENDHAQCTFVDYVREEFRPCMWASQGIGELAASDQEVIRKATNYTLDNADLKIRPPQMVDPTLYAGKQIIAPGLVIPMRRKAGEFGMQKIDIGGDAEEMFQAEAKAHERLDRLFQIGTGAYIDPIAKQNRMEAMINDWLDFVERSDRLAFLTIQQYATDKVRSLANDGQAFITEVSGDDIRGDFLTETTFAASSLDPKAVESQLKMFTTYLSTMDRNGLTDWSVATRLMAMLINPTWGKMIKAPQRAQEDDYNDVMRIWNNIVNDAPEDPMVMSGNHAYRAQLLQQLINMPSINEDGQPITDEATGQTLPNRGSQIVQTQPGPQAKYLRRLKFEQMQATQTQNASTGRLGVKPLNNEEEPTRAAA